MKAKARLDALGVGVYVPVHLGRIVRWGHLGLVSTRLQVILDQGVSSQFLPWSDFLQPIGQLVTHSSDTIARQSSRRTLAGEKLWNRRTQRGILLPFPGTSSRQHL